MTSIALTIASSRWLPAADTEAWDSASILGSRIEKRIEDLEDARWQVRDTNERLIAVLDAQDDVILRFDPQARLSFVNRSFAERFAIAPEDVLHTEFSVNALKADGQAPATHGSPARTTADRIDQPTLVATVDGERWYDWRYTQIPSPDGLSFDRLVIGQDVTERTRHQRELATARDQAEAANQAKSRFLASMSHEIRTPMNGILGMGGLLRQTSLTAEQQTYADAIDQSARTLLSLIDEILDFSRVESGHLVLKEAPFSLVDCVQSAVELLATRAHEKQLELTWIVERRVPRLVFGDQTRVRQILLNLIGNAIKYTDRGGVCIEVASTQLTANRCQIAVAVSDTGDGLSDEKVALIFTEFERAGAEAAGREAGTGLGLAIARRLARAMDGDIDVKTAPGKGATFTVMIELSVAAGCASDARYSVAAEGRTALLAFDRLIERRALSRMLRQWGVETIEMSDISDEAIVCQILEQTKQIDLLVVDAGDDPTAAGRLLRRIREVGNGGDVNPVVLITPASKDATAAFREQGFTGHLTRPVRPTSILDRLDRSPRADLDRSGRETRPPLLVREPQVSAPLADAGNGNGRPRVLLAEDNDINALLAITMLKRHGCPVVHVSNGNDAIIAVKRSVEQNMPFDLIMMDLHMPELDGIAASARIRAFCSEQGLAAPSIAAVTANAFPEDRERCLEAGMNNYLSKPFDREELAILLASLRDKPRKAVVLEQQRE